MSVRSSDEFFLQEFQIDVAKNFSRIQEQLCQQHQEVIANFERLHGVDKNAADQSSSMSSPRSDCVPTERTSDAIDLPTERTSHAVDEDDKNFAMGRFDSLQVEVGTGAPSQKNQQRRRSLASSSSGGSAESAQIVGQASMLEMPKPEHAPLPDFEVADSCNQTFQENRSGVSEYTRPAGMMTLGDGRRMSQSTLSSTSAEFLRERKRGRNARNSGWSGSTGTAAQDEEDHMMQFLSTLTNEQRFSLHPCFEVDIDSDTGSQRSGAGPKFEWSVTVSMMPEFDEQDAEQRKSRLGDIQMHSGGFWKLFVVRPNSLSRVAWDLLGSILIVYDLIALPLQAFDLQLGYFQTAMALIIAIFWSIDILWSFRTGIFVDGLLEMRPTRIMRRYFKTWFPFDFLVAVLDWTFVISLIGSGDSGDSGSFSFGKWMRILRLSRLGRLVKLARVARILHDSIASEVCLAIVQIMRLVLVIVFLNHYVACAWYALGSADEDENRWVVHYKIDERSLVYQYLTSLHWSLTQFTPASMEIFPRNEMERLFNIGALVFGLITFSSFISSLTSAMAHLAGVRGDRLREESMLRQFLSERKVSVELGMRIRRYFCDNYEVRKNRLHEIDIAFFNDLPPFLLAILHAEIYMPILCWHPMFKCYAAFDMESVKKICHFAVGQRSQLQRHNVFLNGTVATEMLFIVSGELVYHCNWTGHQHGCASGQWLCEPVLWGKWMHRGRLSVQVGGELVSLSASIFCSIALERLNSFHSLRMYARQFVSHVSQGDVVGQPITDMPMSIDIMQDMVSRAFTGRNSLMMVLGHISQNVRRSIRSSLTGSQESTSRRSSMTGSSYEA